MVLNIHRRPACPHTSHHSRLLSRESRKQPSVCKAVTGSWLLHRGVAVFWNIPKVTDYSRSWNGSVVCVCENGCFLLNFNAYEVPRWKVHPFPVPLFGPMLLDPSLSMWFPTGVLDQYAQPFSLHEEAKRALGWSSSLIESCPCFWHSFHFMNERQNFPWCFASLQMQGEQTCP